MSLSNKYVNTRNCSEISISDKDAYDITLKMGYTFKTIIRDGNCLYRAMSDALYHTQSKYHIVKKKAIEELEKIYSENPDDFFNIDSNGNVERITPDYYKPDRVFGDDLVIRALRRVYSEYNIIVLYLCSDENDDVHLNKRDNVDINESLKNIILVLNSEHYSVLHKYNDETIDLYSDDFINMFLSNDPYMRTYKKKLYNSDNVTQAIEYTKIYKYVNKIFNEKDPTKKAKLFIHATLNDRTRFNIIHNILFGFEYI